MSYSNVAKNNAIIRELEQSVKNMILDADKTQSEIDLNVLRLDEVLAHIEAMKADAGFSRAKTVESQVTADAILANTEKTEVETGLLQQESDKYAELTDRVLRQYDESIKKIAAESNFTEQQSYWYVFDKADQYQPKVLGVGTDIKGMVKRVRHAKNKAARQTGNFAY